MKPGLYSTLSNEEYHASAGISNSGIRLILDCPARYYHRYLSGEVTHEQTEQMLMGSVLHVLLLEPDAFDYQFFVMPKIDRRTKEGKERFAKFQSMAESANLTVIQEETYKEALTMSQAIANSKHHKLLESGFAEHSIYWEYNGTLLKTRPDLYCPTRKLIVDIKKTASIHPQDFIRSIYKYGYHSQAAMAIDGLASIDIQITTYILLAIESEPPYIIQPYRLLNEWIDAGREEYVRGALKYKECLEWNLWPSYSDSIIDLSLPEYYKHKSYYDE